MRRVREVELPTFVCESTSSGLLKKIARLLNRPSLRTILELARYQCDRQVVRQYTLLYIT